jgi:hypothetical protein
VAKVLVLAALPDLVSRWVKMALPRRPLTHFAVIAAGLLHERIGPGGSPGFDFAPHGQGL